MSSNNIKQKDIASKIISQVIFTILWFIFIPVFYTSFAVSVVPGWHVPIWPSKFPFHILNQWIIPLISFLIFWIYIILTKKANKINWLNIAIYFLFCTLIAISISNF